MIINENLDFRSFHLKDIQIVTDMNFLKGRPTIGIFGSALEFQKSRNLLPHEQLQTLCEQLGKLLGTLRWNVITAGSPGIPYWVAKAAKKHGACVLTLSAYKSEDEHTSIKQDVPAFPTDQHNTAIYTGLGFQFIDALIAHTCHCGIVIGGGLGSLIESAIVVEYEKPLICVQNSGGIADIIPGLFNSMIAQFKNLQLYQLSTLTEIETKLKELESVQNLNNNTLDYISAQITRS